MEFAGTPVASHAMMRGLPDSAVRMGGTIYVAPEVLDEIRLADPGTLRAILGRLRLVEIPTLEQLIHETWIKDFEARSIARTMPG